MGEVIRQPTGFATYSDRVDPAEMMGKIVGPDTSGAHWTVVDVEEPVDGKVRVGFVPTDDSDLLRLIGQ